MTTGVAAVKSVCVGCMLLEFAFVLIWLLLLYWLTVLILLAWLVLDFPSVLLLHLVTLLAMVLITPELNRLKCITVTKNKKQNTSWSNVIQFNVVLYLIHEFCLILTLMSYPKDLQILMLFKTPLSMITLKRPWSFPSFLLLLEMIPGLFQCLTTSIQFIICTKYFCDERSFLEHLIRHHAYQCSTFDQDLHNSCLDLQQLLLWWVHFLSLAVQMHDVGGQNNWQVSCIHFVLFCIACHIRQ